MKTATQFLLTLFAWIMFVIGGFTFLRLEADSTVQASRPEPPTVALAPIQGPVI